MESFLMKRFTTLVKVTADTQDFTVEFFSKIA